MKTSSQLRLLLALYRHVADQKKNIYLGTAYSVLNKVFDLFPPLLIGLAVDTVVKKDQSFLGRWGDWDQFGQLVVIAVLTVVIWSLESFFEYLYSVKWKTLAQEIQHQVRMESYSHLLRLDQGFFEDQHSGNLIAIVNDDVNQLERFLDVGVNELIQVTVTVLVIGAIYFYESPVLALLSFITMPAIVYGSVWFQHFLTPLYKGVRDRVGLLTGEINNSLQGISTIRSFARENENYEKMKEFSLNYYRANEKAIHVSSLFTPLIRVMVMIGFLMTLLVGGRLTLSGRIDVGTYSVLIFLIQRMLWPLTRLGQTLDLLQRAMASVQRIFFLLDTPVGLQEGALKISKKDIRGEIELRHVTFGYKGREKVLKNFNLRIKAGESLGLVGATGSGKSSLVKLIQRFYDPDEGELLLDGKNLKDYSFKSLREALSLVSQDVYLFHGTVMENLKFAKPQASFEEVVEACRQAFVHDFILSLPEGYDTIVGERGQRLSGGQKQRLSIARALLADCPIVVLDEATSAVDNVTEAELQKQLEKDLKGKTTLTIAHRLSTVVRCDRIIVMKDGRIVEEGSHAELISRKGIYHELWSVQTGTQRELNPVYV